MRRAHVTVLALGMLLAALLGMAGCTGRQADSGSSAGGVTATTPEQAVSSFLDATKKHGTLTFTSGKQAEEQKVEYWFDGDRYRLTWFNADGSVRIHMISPDGTKLYYCRTEDELCEISYTLPEMHQWIFNGPPGWKLGEGVRDGDLTAYTFTIQKLWDIEGASQTFYLEDLVVYADDTRIVKTVARTSSRKPGSPDDLTTSVYAFDEPELGAELPADVFELPYEIGTPAK